MLDPALSTSVHTLRLTHNSVERGVWCNFVSKRREGKEVWRYGQDHDVLGSAGKLAQFAISQLVDYSVIVYSHLLFPTSWHARYAHALSWAL